MKPINIFVNNFQTIASIFKTSGHEARLSLLKALNSQDMTASDLSEILGNSPVYVHRHLQILTDEGLVEKIEKKFTLSTIGKIFVNSLGWAEVMTKYNTFWYEHSVANIPESLLERISTLKNTSLIYPAPRIIDQLLKMILKARKKILGTSDRLPEIAVNALLKTLENQKVECAYSLIGGTPSVVEWINHLKNMIPDNFSFKIVDIEKIYMGILIVDDIEAGILFPNKNGVMDWNCGIIGKDPEFISWAEENFWNMYDKGNDFRSNLK